jgi:uncharacterized protein (DUF58 family)
MATELAIVAAASLASHIVTRESLPAGLAVEADDPLTGGVSHQYFPPRNEREHLMGVLEALARVQVSTGTSLVDLLERDSARLSWGATIVVITGLETDNLYDALAYLRRAGFAVTLILIQPAQTPDSLQGLADTLDIQVNRIWREENLERLS